MKTILSRILLTVITAELANCLHLYAGVQQTYLVSQSPTLKNIYACKDRCFALNDTFPYPMKYIRTVWARSGTNHMYLQGHCYLNLPSLSPTDPWIKWSALNETNYVSTPEEVEKWRRFDRECESKLVEMSEGLRVGLGLTRVHSEFVFYSDGKFENTQEDKIGDINDVFKNMLTSL